MKSHEETGSLWPLRTDQCSPVFIVGMNGSGTTMLRGSLGRHPNLYGFPGETRLIPYLIATTAELDLSCDDNFLCVWKRVLAIPVFRFRTSGRPPPLPTNWKAFPRDLASVLDAVFSYLAAKSGKVRWIEKTPQHVLHIESLNRLWPGAKFIHIIRDGRACAASLRKRWRRTPEYTIYRWKNVLSIGRTQGRKVSKCYFEVKYEDLTNDPDYWMKEICAFIQVTFHPDVLVSRRPQNRGVLGGIEPNRERWRTELTLNQIERLENIAGAYLAELGYPVENDKGSADPSAWQLGYWKLTDYLKQFIHGFGKSLRTGDPKRWLHLLRLPAIALKQWRINRY